MLDKVSQFLYNNICCKYAAMAQVVEHILGKDEVTSSNLVSSSKKQRDCFDSPFVFCLC